MSHDCKAVYLVKTHDPPQDSQPAIYIVRNGLAAVRSYKHYLSDMRQRHYSLEQIILGEPLFGSWGNHLDRWNPLNRPHTLVLKYEDLIQRPECELDRVAFFLRLSPRRKWTNNFDAWHAANPKFFRQGPSVAPEHGFTDYQVQLFSALHGDWMARFGYSPPGFITPRELRAVFAHHAFIGNPRNNFQLQHTGLEMNAIPSRNKSAVAHVQTAAKGSSKAAEGCRTRGRVL